MNARAGRALLCLLAGCASEVAPAEGTAEPAARGAAIVETASESAADEPERSMPPTLRAAWIRAVQEDASPAYDWSAEGQASSNAVRWTVDAAGLRVVSEDGWFVRLTSRRFGRDGALAELPDPTVATDGNDARLVRAGLTERWLHGPLGVEHLFEVAERPSGEGALVVELEVEGLTPRAAGEAVTLSDERGVQAHYTELWVEDAGGAALSARLEVTHGAIRIRVDDGQARYPLIIDPLLATQQAKLEASDGAAGAEFGYRVALDGDTAVVGAWLDNTTHGTSAGSVYVFVRSGAAWIQQAKLEASDGAANDFFGFSVALQGDTALVGAEGDDTARGASAGSAYVFVRSGTTWTQQAKLEASDGAASDFFGCSVALDGHTALVAANADDTARGVNAGSAYVFVRSGTTWTQQAKLEASDGAADDRFAISIVLDGETALVGAYLDDTARGANAGSAYVFVRSGTTWTQQAKLEASDGAPRDVFGYPVALDGDTALVGAWRDDTARGAGAGSAYVFVRSGTTWTQQAKLEASDGAASDGFGGSVALEGDTALVGAGLDDTARGTDVGSVYVFVRGGAAWTQQAKVAASDGAASDGFGASVALDGDTALVGAPRDDTARGWNAGSAYVFLVQRSNGDPCTTSSQCASGFCVDGVCCDGACGGGATNDCRACAVTAGAASDGTCGPTTGNACDDGLACTTTDACSAGTCAGSGSPCMGGMSCAEGTGGSYLCSACPAGTYSTEAAECTACPAGTWSSTGATSCAAWTDCAAGSYVASAGTSMGDRVCTPCASGTYSSTTNASACGTWSDCAAGTYVSGAGTATSDRACTACDPGSYSASANATACAAWTSCTATEYESVAGSATRDRVCAPLTECTVDEFESATPTATSDRECTTCTVCAADETEVAPCTATEDTVCEPSDAGMPDGGVSVDASIPDAEGGVLDAGTEVSADGGCGCRAVGADRGGSGAAFALLSLALALVLRRRRARRDADPSKSRTRDPSEVLGLGEGCGRGIRARDPGEGWRVTEGANWRCECRRIRGPARSNGRLLPSSSDLAPTRRTKPPRRRGRRGIASASVFTQVGRGSSWVGRGVGRGGRPRATRRLRRRARRRSCPA